MMHGKMSASRLLVQVYWQDGDGEAVERLWVADTV